MGAMLHYLGTHLFSDRTINQASFGFSRIFNHILSFGTGSCEAAVIGIPGANLGSHCDSLTGYPASLNQSTKDCISCGITSFQMTNYMSLGDRGYAPYQGGTNVYSVSDTLDLIRGKHDIKFGATFRAEQMNIRNNAFQDGFVTENGAATLATTWEISCSEVWEPLPLTIRRSLAVRSAAAETIPPIRPG